MVSTKIDFNSDTYSDKVTDITSKIERRRCWSIDVSRRSEVSSNFLVSDFDGSSPTDGRSKTKENSFKTLRFAT